MGKTSIQWTDRSVNPLRVGRGHYCQKISPGCANCYASRFQPRVGNPVFGGTSSPLPVIDPGHEQFWLDEDKLDEVRRRKVPTKWFWCDMTDMFGSWVPDEWIDRCFQAMVATPHHTHQVLTKRPERMLEYVRNRWGAFDGTGYHRMPNIWLGVSVEDQQRAEERIPLLLKVPAAVRFLSVEPLLEDLGTLNLIGISWVIVGGESGSGSRPCASQWVRRVVEQCMAAEVPCFVKQLGANVEWDGFQGGYMGGPSNCWPKGTKTVNEGRSFRVWLTDRKGGEPSEWPEDLRVRQFPAAVSA